MDTVLFTRNLDHEDRCVFADDDAGGDGGGGAAKRLVLLLPAEGSHRTEDLPIIQQQLAAVATAAAVAGGGGGQPLQRQPRRVLCLVPEESVTEDDLQAKEGRGFGQWQRLMTIRQRRHHG